MKAMVFAGPRRDAAEHIPTQARPGYARLDQQRGMGQRESWRGFCFNPPRFNWQGT
jgi:hypothetical protein